MESSDMLKVWGGKVRSLWAVVRTKFRPTHGWNRGALLILLIGVTSYIVEGTINQNQK